MLLTEWLIQEIKGVDFIAINTDRQALQLSISWC
jgi:cell division GTPase FtsZ